MLSHQQGGAIRPKVGSLPRGEKESLLWCQQYTAKLLIKSTYAQCSACMKQNRTFGPSFLLARWRQSEFPVHAGIDFVLICQENSPDQFLRASGSRTGDEMKVAARAMRLRGEQPWGVSSSVRGRWRRSIWMAADLPMRQLTGLTTGN